MKITIGALVLCKVLISDPPSTLVTNPNSNLNAPTSVEYQAPSVAAVRQNSSALNNISKQPVIKEGNVVYTMLEGEVVNVYKHSYFAPVGKTGKFEKMEEEDLVIKSKEIDHLVISSRACGLLSDYIYDEKSYKAQQQKKINARKKSQEKEEIIVIRSDKVPEGYEKVKLDSAVEDAIKKEYVNDVKSEELSANETFLKNLENDQERFVKDQKIKEGFSPIEELKIDELPSEPEALPVAVKEAPVKEEEKIKEEKSSKDLFASWEEERKAELEAERKKDLALKSEEEKQIKKSKQVSPSRPKSSESQSIIKDAFKIITTE